MVESSFIKFGTSSRSLFFWAFMAQKGVVLAYIVVRKFNCKKSHCTLGLTLNDIE